MRAKAFAEWVARIDPTAVVKIEQIIENGSLLGRFGVWLYNFIHRIAPRLHNVYFFIVEGIILTQFKSVTFGGTYYRSLLVDFRPTHILSVHDSTNRGYFEDARRVLGHKVKCSTYCGEFSGGYGYSINWINTSADQFVARTPAARDYAIQKGISPDRSEVFHKLLPPDAFGNPLSSEDIKAAKSSLGLNPAAFTLFLTTGGFGANHHLQFLKALLPFAKRLQVIVVCGRNKAILETVQEFLKTSALSGYTEGYSSRIPQFMQIADAVVTRGGANTTMEALHFACPIIFDGIGGMMPQERCTWRYFRDQDAAVHIKRSRDLASIVKNWLEHPQRYQSLQANLQQLNPKEDPQAFIERLIS